MDATSRVPLAGANPGERWVIRYRLPDGSATDVIGWIEAIGPDGSRGVEVGDRDPVQRVDPRTVVAARRAPAAPGGRDPLRTSAAELERIALPGWLAVHEPLGEWTLRSAGGFTGRANSCLAVGDPGVGYPEAAARIRRYAAEHGIAAWAQVVAGSAEDRGLRDLGWRPTYVATEVLVAALADLLGTDPTGPGDHRDRAADRGLARRLPPEPSERRRPAATADDLGGAASAGLRRGRRRVRPVRDRPRPAERGLARARVDLDPRRPPPDGVGHPDRCSRSATGPPAAGPATPTSKWPPRTPPRYRRTSGWAFAGTIATATWAHPRSQRS